MKITFDENMLRSESDDGKHKVVVERHPSGAESDGLYFWTVEVTDL